MAAMISFRPCIGNVFVPVGIPWMRPMGCRPCPDDGHAVRRGHSGAACKACGVERLGRGRLPE
jgi:hypothetical protein